MIRLSPDAAQAFSDALARPAAVNESLAVALDRPRGFRWAAGTLLSMTAFVDLTVAFEPPDEDGWIVARVLEVPGAMSQGKTREQARENALEALRAVLAPDEELAGRMSHSDCERLRFIAAA